MTTDDNNDTGPKTGTKERILAIALDLVAQQGASALKIRTVANRSAVAISVVTHHFESKQGLLDACKDWYYTELGQLVMKVMADGQDRPLSELVEKALRESFRFSREHMGVLRMLTRDVFADGGLIEPYRGFGHRPHFNQALGTFAPKMGLSPQQARVRLQAVATMLTRFATANSDELGAILGMRGAAAVQSAEDHIVDIGRLLLVAADESSLESE